MSLDRSISGYYLRSNEDESYILVPMSLDKSSSGYYLRSNEDESYI